MRLTTIKLAGFKSFVDPTVLHLPTNMSAVVGPNGCGKSNIIDAVRWVMGESAASRLRGDALVDVIFSGSSGRKPIGLASVELIFDNADGAIAGEYASYTEISVRRTVSRDGQSQYFLNGTRCRRRDITDLFLGTGLGPRSYSIIEQGMISEIVEADPEQLRSHLEEAAGISRYKERRKDTESRIRATRENLDRVRDVSDEVSKQLDHLKRQARAAERWKALKSDYVKLEAELKALTLRTARVALQGHAQTLADAGLNIEKRIADQRRCEAQLEASRDRHTAAGEHLNGVQAELYKLGAEIARVEQRIQHNRELTDQLQRAHAESERASREIDEHLIGDRARYEGLAQALTEVEPQLARLRDGERAAAESLRAAELELADWQAGWDAYASTSSEVAQSAEVERTRLDYLDRQHLDADKRRCALQSEQQACDLEAMERSLQAAHDEHGRLSTQIESLSAHLNQHREKFDRSVEQERTLETTLSDRRGQLEFLLGRLASLETLQHAALGEQAAAANAWLEHNALTHAKRLGEVLNVDGEWERAVEIVLDSWLESTLVESPVALGDALAGLANADLTLLSAAPEDGTAAAGTLAARTRGSAAARRLLTHVHTAQSVADALAVVRQLPEGDSIITPAGDWFGADFARVDHSSDDSVGVLAREREIQDLQSRVAVTGNEVERLAQTLTENRQARLAAEQRCDEAQRELYAAQKRLAETAGQLQSQSGRLADTQERSARIEHELSDLGKTLDDINEQALAARSRLDAAMTRMTDLEEQRKQLDAERRGLLERREEARMAAREANEQVHECALSIESQRAASLSLEQALTRMQAQRAQLDARAIEIAAQLASSRDPESHLDSERQTYLNQRLLVDKRLVQARTALADCDAEFRRLDQERHAIEQNLNERREQLAELRLREQEHRLRADTLSSAISAAGFDAESMLAAVPADADSAQWGADLAGLEHKIQRLEPVNLAAIQEYDEQSQRKNYLDAQLADLTAALETLENAIRKIDRETRLRFKETFEKVNSGIQELFPRLFGGGHAHLELTGDDLLSTGVSIMARPPGKRVSSISLLSGGEKALTAVALVFAIFRLNPAPFCLLDEVDSPLDEGNIGRFTSLVAEMSDRVQFIFVTHNKATMEAAAQLCGVTMREPGVSRLVQVDLAEATRLAGAA
ncbi:MAG: chromosome segregation protein SMC [Rhodanobacteraceae bacterium]